MQFGTVAHAGTTRAAALTADGWRALRLRGTAGMPRTCPPSSPLAAPSGRTPLLGETLDGAEPLAPLPRPGQGHLLRPQLRGAHPRDRAASCRATPPSSPSTPTASSAPPTTSRCRPAPTSTGRPSSPSSSARRSAAPTARQPRPPSRATPWPTTSRCATGSTARCSGSRARRGTHSTPTGPRRRHPRRGRPRRPASTVTCRVNGEEVQRDSTATLVFDAADLLAYISTFTMLRPGDLVLTGTPGGVGVARDPKRFLADGDVARDRDRGHRPAAQHDPPHLTDPPRPDHPSPDHTT